MVNVDNILQLHHKVKLTIKGSIGQGSGEPYEFLNSSGKEYNRHLRECHVA